MPIVHVEILEGRTLEQKRSLAKEVTDGVVRALDCPANAVTVVIQDMKKEHYAVAGVLNVDKK